jgi:hypothetical protein
MSSTGQMFTIGDVNLLEDLRDYFQSLQLMDHISCPKRVNLLYSKLLSRSSLLPVSKDFEHSLIGFMHMFWVAVFHVSWMLCRVAR